MKTALLLLACAAPSLLAQTSNPFPSPVPKGDIVATVETFASIPNSSGAFARVNQLATTPAGATFAMDQRGPMYAISADGATVTAYLDLRAYPALALYSTSEAGFQSFAFHPDFNTAGAAGYGKFYTVHSTTDRVPTADFTPGGGDNTHDTLLLEWTASDPAATVFTPAIPGALYRELMRIEQPYTNHNAGLAAFNPNARPGEADYGKLYLGIGDGGSGGDPLNLAQNKLRIFGKIIRIDPLGTNSTNGRYGIPADNPFVGDALYLPEIWALGLRNPQRFSWDSAGSGQMFIADIGQGVVEEIDVGVPGANYGWRAREGSYVYISGGSVGANTRNDADGYTYPIAEYDHSEGNAVTAGFVVRGLGASALRGQFLFGDIRLGRVFYFNVGTLPDGGAGSIRELRLRDAGGVEKSYLQMIQGTAPGASRADLRFGTDLAGNIYLLNKQDGIIRRIVAPQLDVSSVSLSGTIFTLQFTSEPGRTDFLLKGSPDLQSFPDDLTDDALLTEPGAGQYQMIIDVAGFPSRYFFRLER